MTDEIERAKVRGDNDHTLTSFSRAVQDREIGFGQRHNAFELRCREMA